MARTRSQLALTWGVETFLGADVEHTDEMVRQVDEALLHIGRVKKGDLVVIIAGSPPGIPGSTNALRIHRMGDAIDGAAPAYRRTPLTEPRAVRATRRAVHGRATFARAPWRPVERCGATRRAVTWLGHRWRCSVPRVRFELTLDGV